MKDFFMMQFFDLPRKTDFLKKFMFECFLAPYSATFECNGNEGITGSRLQQDYGNKTICLPLLPRGVLRVVLFINYFQPRDTIAQ